MRLSCSLQIKDDGNEGWEQSCLGTVLVLRGCSGFRWMAEDSGLQCHCGCKLTGVWMGQRNLQWETPEQSRADSVCAVVCKGCETPTDLAPIPVWNSDSRNGLHSPLTGGSTAALCSFRAVLSFLHPWKKKKKELIWVSEPQLHAVSHLKKAAGGTAALLQPKAFQGWDSSGIHQAEGASKQYHQWANVIPKPVSSGCLRNFC